MNVRATLMYEQFLLENMRLPIFCVSFVHPTLAWHIARAFYPFLRVGSRGISPGAEREDTGYVLTVTLCCLLETKFVVLTYGF